MIDNFPEVFDRIYILKLNRFICNWQLVLSIHRIGFALTFYIEEFDVRNFLTIRSTCTSCIDQPLHIKCIICKIVTHLLQ